MVTTIHIRIYQTYRLQTYCSNNYSSTWEAAERAKIYLENAFDTLDNHTADVDIAKSRDPDPPQEGPEKDDFTGECVCASPWDCNYNGMFDWWVDWLKGDCNDVNRATHTDLLLTDYDKGQGRGGGRAAVACVGQTIPDVEESYQSFGYQDKHNQMDTVLEEVAHSLQNQGSCSHNDDDDDGATSHDSGEVVYDIESDDYAATPIGLQGCSNDCASDSSLDTNYCLSRADDDGDDVADGWALFYSDCTACWFP